MENGSGGYVREQEQGFFSLYTSLGIAKGDSGLKNDGWTMDSAVVGT